MNIKAILVWPFAFLMMLFSLLLPPKAEGIAAVYIGSGGSGITRNYKVDLSRRNFWVYEHSPMKGRNEKAPFEGFCFAGRLGKGKIAAFLETADEYGFAGWEGDYDHERDEDPMPGGGPWHVTIVFADGATKESTGYFDYPEHWDEMREAFKALTGKDILL